MKQRLLYILGMMLALTLVLAACGGAQPPADSGGSAPAEEEAPAEEAPAEGEEEAPAEGEEEAPAEGDVEFLGDMPGEGKTVTLGRATWDTGFFQAELFGLLLEELGYTIDNVDPLANDAFYISAANGDVDMWANGWFPIHNVYLEDPKVEGKIEPVGYEVKSGALQGYLIDKATSEEYGITNIGDLTDPEIAALFDGDGNGKADLIGCPEGWGCAGTINYQLPAYGLEDTVEHVQGEYALLMADTIARYQRGEPILFYTWTPNWTVNKLKPGEDVVWLEVPEPALPEDQAEMESEEFTTVSGITGCATGEDTCAIGWPYGDIRVVANSEFLAENPAVENLALAVTIPFEDITEQNAWMEDNDARSAEEVREYAQGWIEENRETVDGWLAVARGEVPPPESTDEGMDEGMDETDAMTDTDTMDEEAPMDEEPMDEGADAPVPADPNSMPGEGTTVTLGRATWDTGFFQAELFGLLLEELGYTIDNVEPLANDAFYISAANGDVDMWANGWFPIHNVYLEDPKVQGKIEPVGYEVKSGALQGYLIDKATSEEHGITNLGDLSDPEVAALFDGDGNGKADLIGCPEGWGCAKVINHQIPAYGLEDTVEHVQGEYALLMADTIARYQRGEPILFYTWTPNWTVNKLKPGEDVVWLEVPEPALPEDQAEMESEEFTTVSGITGCATGEDTCAVGWTYGDIRVVANSEFLAANPAVRGLAEAVEIPFEDITEQNAWMEDNDMRSSEEIREYAQGWIEENRDMVDSWLAAARVAAE